MRRSETDPLEPGLLVRLAGVDAGYDGSPVLHDVDFEARAGEVAFVIGPATAGKTTLMHMLRLALLPSGGRATMFGVDVARLNARGRAKLKRRIGYVAENPVFVDELTAAENIALPLRLAGRRPREFQTDIQELVEFVGLGVAAEEPVSQLSGAQRRKVAIARALAAKPDLILADDPTAGLSPESGRRVIRLLGEMRRVGAGIIITSQDETLTTCVPCAHWRLQMGRLYPVEQDEPETAGAYR